MNPPPWMSGDTGKLPTDGQSLAKYGVAAGAAIALLAPNKWKTGGLAMAAVFGFLLVTMAPAPAAD